MIFLIEICMCFAGGFFLLLFKIEEYFVEIVVQLEEIEVMEEGILSQCCFQRFKSFCSLSDSSFFLFFVYMKLNVFLSLYSR